MKRPACDVCAEHEGVREFTPGERAAWPHVAAWVRSVCPTRREFFRRSAERPRWKATA
ncbi:MAG: hypothetical protein H0U00_14645 [Actinobacteria bacterium]|nr:hypothetical protein [Actinomycetota bacterium]